MITTQTKKSTSKKLYRIAPLAFAVASTLLIAPVQADSPALGDLNIYSAGNQGEKGPTIMFMVEGSTFTNPADGRPDHWADVEIIGTPKPSTELYPSSLPVYDRNYYFQSISGEVEFTRLTRMKDAIYYLMDTEGAMPDSFKVGIGRYSASPRGLKYIGEGLTGSVKVPAETLGPVSESNNPSSQRYKIKKFIADMCATDRLCTGEAPMAAAYAEAGAYMMGTKTGPMSKDGDVYMPTRVIRRKYNASKVRMDYQYCPPENRVPREYVRNGSTTYRAECEEDKWVVINKDNVAPWDWASAILESSPPTPSQILDIKNADKREYDLVWFAGAPVGTDVNGDNWSPISLNWTNYAFDTDDFDYENPSDSNEGGVDANYTYYIDRNLLPPTTLEPDFQYRALRKKYFVSGRTIDGFDYQGGKEYWEYCPKDKAQLVNYIYSSYRLMCKEEDWIPIYTQAQMLENGFTRKTAWLVGNRPRGVGVTQDNKLYLYDALANPYDGWRYYYDTKIDRADNPPLPRTLSTGYSVSGMRNASPDVRNHQTYTYQHPNYNECSATQTGSNGPGTTTSSAKDVENAIIFFTAGWPRSAGLRPLKEMNMSMTAPATSNTLNPVSGSMSTDSCLASGLSENGKNPSRNYWGCIGEYSKRLRMGAKPNSTEKYSNPANVSVKTGVFMFTANQELLTPTGTDSNGIPQYSCSVATSVSQRNACLLGKYGAGYGEGGFFQSDSDNPESSYETLAKAFSVMEQPSDSNSAVIPTSMPIVPTNAFLPSKMLTNGYLPLLQPLPGSSQSHWSGNLRKYKQIDEGFVDSRQLSPFSAASDSILTTKTKDLWSKDGLVDSNSQAGGAYSQIPMPTSDTSDTPRNVYISSSSTGDLTSYTPSNIDDVSITGIDSTEQDTVRRLLLNYMGYTISDYVKGTTSVADVTATYSSGDNKSLGGVYHSTPIALMPEAAREGTSKDYSKYKTFIMFGAMDNAIHIVDDSTGVEVLSYFPQEVLANNGQYKAIVPELSADEGEAKPSFGVDAPWTSYASYGFKGEDSDDESALVAKELFAFGGARLGAKAYYGIDLTGLEKVSSDASNSSTSLGEFNPKQLFTITDSTTGFERLGYTWAKPVITHINWNGERTLVAILSGGYDASEYDKSDAERQAEHEAADAAPTTLGNAIYIVDAKSGELLIKASNGTKTSNATGFESSNADGDAISVSLPNLKYSVPGSVKVLDRDADELADHLYFADLDGQLFRMDIDNIAAVNTNISKARLVRLADLNTDSSDKIPGPRFYETPAVTIQEKDGYRFATVSVASGDRSNPLRVSNPDSETSSISVKFQSTGGEVTLKASKVDGSWVKESGFPAGNSITLDSGTGQIVIKPQVFSSDTKVEATTGFVTTYTATSELNASSTESSNNDPLAPKISLANGNLTVTLATSADITSTPNYVYTVYDKDVTSINLYSTNMAKLKTQDIEVTNDDIEDKFPDVSDSANEETSGYDKSGWRMPLLRFGSNATGSNFYQSDNESIKAIGPISAIANTLYVSAYNPNDGDIDTTGCTAEVVGSTEVYQLCLPYGICDSEYVEQYQRISYGKGILPLSWATDNSGSKRKFYGQDDYVTLEDETGGGTAQQNTQSPLNNDTLYGAPFVQSVYGFKGVLKPQEWFDYSIKLPE